MKKRARIVLEGVVQGVGYRPFIHRLATSFGLSGWVKNTTQGLIIEVEGENGTLDQFLQKATTTHPPLAQIERYSISSIPAKGSSDFIVQPSESAREKSVHVPADISVCDDCVAELLDSDNRRYRYPFINCVNCGARFTIIRDIPYDRKLTTMQKFQMCQTCASEYHSLSHRRYHTQPNCCPDCGPHLTLWDENGKKIDSDDPITDAVDRLHQGQIIAIKGLGGFHLVCNAEDDSAVRKLRERKSREAKPFAIMSGTIADIRSYCEVTPEEEKLLLSLQRPIVLLRKKEKAKYIAESIAPNNKYLGVMLPYTPLHYLLFYKTGFRALVMTSGNISDEPIVIDNQVAKTTFRGIVDRFLVHNRDIYNRCDDSIAMIVDQKPIILRRARGYTPLPLKLPFTMPEILGCGSELKNAFCLAKGKFAFLSQHIGDLKTAETFSFYQETISRFEQLFRIQPKVIAYDLHPDYLSTQYAQQQIADSVNQINGIPVQHHHAHIASCMAENRIPENTKIIGVAFDGTGYGTDGTIWGCEFIVADYQSFTRVAHLAQVPLPGGDAATAENWRMALSYLYTTYGKEVMELPLDIFDRISSKEITVIMQAIEKKINTPLTSSAGRLFDAVSALLGICYHATYEAQPAIQLEMIVDEAITGKYPYTITEKGTNWIIDCQPMIENIVQEIKKETDKSCIAAKFHNTVISFSADICQRIKKETGIKSIALSGGTFQNRIILSRLSNKLKEAGFTVYTHHDIPPNDACISLGQVIVANAQINKK